MRALIPRPHTAITLPLSGGDRGTAETIRQMRLLVDHGVKDPLVNRVAIAIVRSSAPAHDEAAEVRGIYEWVRQRIRFVKDIAGKETLRPARTILEIQAGDCDDINGILLPALLGTIGYRTRLVTIASNAADPSAFSHVYAEVWLGGRWIPLDAARPGAQFGQAPARSYRTRLWSLVNDSSEEAGRLFGANAARGSFLGQDRVSAVLSTVPEILRAAAPVVAAARGGTAVVTPQQTAVYGGPGAYLQAPPYAGPGGPGYGAGGSFWASGTSTWLLLGGGVLLALALLPRGRG